MTVPKVPPSGDKCCKTILVPAVGIPGQPRPLFLFINFIGKLSSSAGFKLGSFEYKSSTLTLRAVLTLYPANLNYTKLGWAWKQEHYGRRLPIFETNQETMSIKKFELHNYATIKERLDVPSHVPSFNQSECFISALSSYAMLKLVYDIVRKFSRLGCYKN